MSDGEWAFPDALQPGAEDVSFDLDVALNAVVTLRADVPPDAFTASALGTERVGNGVVIDDDGLVLTIGYLIAEASSIWLTSNSGTTVAAYALAYDHVTGFGLVRAVEPLKATVLQRGTADSCERGDRVFVIGQGGRAHALKARLIDKREFAGYWEYLLDEALFTAPAHPEWGGAALVGKDGKLLGVGSLLVQEVVMGEEVQGNMRFDESRTDRPPESHARRLVDHRAFPGAAATMARNVHYGSRRPTRGQRGRAGWSRGNSRHAAGRCGSRDRRRTCVDPRADAIRGLATRPGRGDRSCDVCACGPGAALQDRVPRSQRLPEEARTALSSSALSQMRYTLDALSAPLSQS